jgi:hypothetical protein
VRGGEGEGQCFKGGCSEHVGELGTSLCSVLKAMVILILQFLVKQSQAFCVCFFL